DLFFECISAIATVGLSTGITRQLLPLSKALLILRMYSGRVGSMTVFMAVTKKKRGKLRYPEEQIIIG
ncbi:MAG: Trk family potassium uptake protein, partial [Clostridia bacterium]|nr:Trk family potassium uptake protein [Clostridia bacterium]